jgi:hypothetical protein
MSAELRRANPPGLVLRSGVLRFARPLRYGPTLAERIQYLE